jgi:pimeloyl-ACP methyl ester carboxylesterase
VHHQTVTRVVALLALLAAASASVQTPRTVDIRGHRLALHVYGSPGGVPAVVSSGDGGWIHLAPHVAELLASKGFYVIGVDARAYLSSFTTRDQTVRPLDEPADYRVLAGVASEGSGKKPILVGVSEGAGLSVLAATDPQTKAVVAGVIGLGLPDMNELGWKWRDAVIYLTHGVPNEPTFSAASVAGKVSPLPLAAIHSTRDEFVPVAEVERIMASAREPKKLWTIAAADHRFSDNLAELDRRVIEAADWIAHNTPH